jgi:UDP-N-acetyl-D-mannosaminuronic acid dehydrogenase
VGLELRGHDFMVAPEVIRDLGVKPCALEDGFEGADGVLIITDHPEYAKLDAARLAERLGKPALMFDCWRILDEHALRAAGVRYAGIGYG